MGLVDPGVGRPLGLGRFSRKPSEGLHQFVNLSLDLTPGENGTYVIIVPCETFAVAGAPMLMFPMVVLFSLFSTPFRPVLLFDHPNATRRAVDPMRVRGGSPKTRSGLSGEITQPFDSAGTVDSTFGSITICCNALESGECWRGTALSLDVVREAATVARRCSAPGDDVNDVLTVRGYGEGRLLTRDRTRRGRRSDGSGP